MCFRLYKQGAALIVKELDCYNINIAALQAIRLQMQGQLQVENYTFSWSSRTDERREDVVAFAISNQIAK